MCDGCGADCLAPLRSKKMMKEIKLTDIKGVKVGQYEIEKSGIISNR